MSNSEIIEQNNQKISELTELVKTKAVGDTSKFLKLPEEAPTATKLVAVDTTNSQEMLTLGAGLSIENGTLNTSGGEKLYMHKIRFSSSYSYNCIIYTRSAEIMTSTILAKWLYDNGFIADYNTFPVRYLIPSGSSSGAQIQYIDGIYAGSETTVSVRTNNIKISITEDNTLSFSYPTGAEGPVQSNFSDTVVEL